MLNKLWLVDLALQYALVIGSAWLALRWAWLAPVAWVVFGTRQHALGVLGHDAAHRTVAPKSPWLNDALGALAFWPLATTVAGFRRFHLPHHWHLAGVRDEELALQNRHSAQWRPRSRAWQVAKDLCGVGLPEIVDLNLVMLRGHLAAAIPMGITLLAISGALVYLGCWWPVLLWWCALGSVFFALNRLRGYTEHVDKPDGGTWAKSEPAWWLRASVYPLGIWDHVDHHRSPEVAWRELRRRRNVSSRSIDS